MRLVSNVPLGKGRPTELTVHTAEKQQCQVSLEKRLQLLSSDRFWNMKSRNRSLHTRLVLPKKPLAAAEERNGRLFPVFNTNKLNVEHNVRPISLKYEKDQKLRP